MTYLLTSLCSCVSDAADDETCRRLVHKEHGSAYSSLHSHATEYLQVVRVVHCAAAASPPHTPKSRDSSSQDVTLGFKVFSPQRLKRAMSVSSEEDIAEAGYEDLTQLQTRVNDWLRHSGRYPSNVFHVMKVS